MGRGKTVALVVLGLALFVTLLSANAAVALDRTAFDADYAKDTAEETDLYAELTAEFTAELADDASAADENEELPIERSQAELLEAALTEPYVQSQVESNIESVYAYLNGEVDELRLGFDPEPLKERLIEEVRADLDDLDPADVPMPNAEEISAMAESQGAFEVHREEFRAEQKERIQAETERELSEAELEQILEEEMDEIREEMYAELDAELDGEFEGPEAAIEEPVRDLQAAWIDALTGELTYEEYATAVETATDDLADAFVAVFEAELDEELPETIELSDELDEEDQAMLDTARTVVSISGPIAYGIAALALVLAGLIAWLAPPDIGAIEVGIISGLIGLLGIAGALVATDQMQAAVGNGETSAFEMFAVEFAVGIFTTLQWQSTGLLVIGVGLVAAGLGIRGGYIDVPTRGGETEPMTNAGAEPGLETEPESSPEQASTVEAKAGTEAEAGTKAETEAETDPKTEM